MEKLAPYFFQVIIFPSESRNVQKRTDVWWFPCRFSNKSRSFTKFRISLIRKYHLRCKLRPKLLKIVLDVGFVNCILDKSMIKTAFKIFISGFVKTLLLQQKSVWTKLPENLLLLIVATLIVFSNYSKIERISLSCDK